MNKVLSIALLVPAILAAQNPVPEKQAPPARVMDVPQAQEKKSEDAQLPKIDLPEFVITGSASMNPPDVQKKEYDETGVYRRTPAENTTGDRDRQTLELGDRSRQTMLLTGQGMSGALSASLGTFFTPSLWASAGFSDEETELSGVGEYWRTKGFTRFADASRGRLGIGGSMLVHSESPLLEGARLAGNASVEMRNYKFYGSLTPAASRGLSSAGFDLAAKSGSDNPYAIRAGLGFQSLKLTDTTSATTENHAMIEGGGDLPVFDVPVGVHLRGDFATVTHVAATTTSLVCLEVGMAPRTFGDFLVAVSGNGYLVRGMAGQQSSYFFPHLEVAFRGIVMNIVTLTYDPSVSFSSLRSEIDRNPYLSAMSAIRHPVNRFSASVAVESDWMDWLRTNVRVSHESGTDIPLYADSTGKGMWSLLYGGTTTLTTFNADLVANVTPNDYFSVGMAVRDSRNSMLGRTGVPYVAPFDASVLFMHSFAWGGTLSPSLSFVSARKSNVVAGSNAGACFTAGLHAEYAGFRSMTLFLTIDNLFDQTYDVWKGYRAEPFRMSLGFSYRW